MTTPAPETLSDTAARGALLDLDDAPMAPGRLVPPALMGRQPARSPGFLRPTPPPVGINAGSPAAERTIGAAWGRSIFALGLWWRVWTARQTAATLADSCGLPPHVGQLPADSAAAAVPRTMLTVQTTPEGAAALQAAYAAGTLSPLAGALVSSMTVAAPATPPRTDVRIVAYPRDKRNRPCTNRLAVVTPYKPGFPQAVKQGTDATWDSEGPSVPDGCKGVWHFDASNLDAVRTVLRSFFNGYDGGPLPTATAPAAPAPVVAAPAPAPETTQPIAFVPAAELAAQRLAESAMDESAALGGELAASLGIETAIAEGQHMAATAHLVRGGVLPSEVNPVAGFNNGAGTRASFATLASAQRYGGTVSGGAASTASTAAAVAAPVTTAVYTRPLAASVPEPLRRSIEAARARSRGNTAAATAATEAANAARAALSIATHEAAASAHVAIKAGQLVAGAKAEGCGSLVGWDGRKEMTRGAIIMALDDAGLPVEWAPATKSAHAHAGTAVNSLSRDGLIVRVDRNRTDKTEREHVAARWIVGYANTDGEVGENFGRIAVTVTLSRAGTLTLTGDESIADKIRDTYNRLVDGEVYSAADVTAWLSRTLRDQLGAVPLAHAWYVQHAAVAQAEALCEAMANRWGSNWLLPALPVATSEQLRAGLARGLRQEAADVIDELDAQRETARKAKRAEIGAGAAVTLLGKLRTVAERAAQYALLLGAEQLSTVRAALSAAIAVVEPLCSDTAQRGSMLEIDR